MARDLEVQSAIEELIKTTAEAATSLGDEGKRARIALDLAEAYAWIVTPNNGHGSSRTS